MRKVLQVGFAILVASMAGVSVGAELPSEFSRALAAADWSKMETVTVDFQNLSPPLI